MFSTNRNIIFILAAKKKIMKKIILISISGIFVSFPAKDIFAQKKSTEKITVQEKTAMKQNAPALSSFRIKGYNLQFNLTNCKDTVLYLAKYTFDKQYIVDTCKKVKNGKAFFKSDKEIEKGVYFIVSQDKARYFDFFINENNKFSISGDIKEIRTFKVNGSKENEKFLEYIKYIATKNEMFGKLKDKAQQMPKKDSAEFMEREVKQLNEDVKKFQRDFYNSNEGTFLADVINLQISKEPENIPKASNGRPDSIYVYHYIKSHYWDGVNFKDDRLLITPFFGDKFKNYFERVIPQMPDSAIAEMDKILSQCDPKSDMFKFLLAYLTPYYEAHKVMGFDKVFVHIINKYIKTGMANDLYDEKVREKIIERGKILEPLLIGNQAPELLMIDTTGGKIVNKMGFDTAKTSESVTKLYYDNVQKITPLLVSLYQTKANYIILVFWDVDCGHCQKEIPELVKTYHELKQKYDVKVYAVYTHTEYDKWRKFIIDKKLDFINVYDPIHINNIREKYDIFSTPVIYLLDKNKVIKAKKLSHEAIPKIIEFLEKEKNNNK